MSDGEVEADSGLLLLQSSRTACAAATSELNIDDISS